MLKKITSIQPSTKVEINDWKIPTDLQLADERFNIPAAVDLIIGGELFYQLMTSGFKRLGEYPPDSQNTVFGWIVGGKMVGLKPTKVFAGLGYICVHSLAKTLINYLPK